MPRGSNNVYTLPANTQAVSGQVIESVKWNTLTQDIENDLNVARPVAAGGTGATTLVQFVQNLMASAQVAYAFRAGLVAQDPASFLSEAQGSLFPVEQKTLTLRGYLTEGDSPPADYIRVMSEPTHPGKFRSADRFTLAGTTDATNGGWWEYNEPEVLPPHFGAPGGNANQYIALNNAFSCALAQGKRVNGLGKKYCSEQKFVFNTSGAIRNYNGTISFENCLLPASNWRFIEINGAAPTVLGSATANVLSGQRLAIVDSAAIAAVNGGDFCCITSSEPAVNATIFASTPIVKSEFFTASGKAAFTIFSDREFKGSYNVANATTIERIPLNITVDWRMNIQGPTLVTPGRGMYIQYARIENLPEFVDDMFDGAIDLYGCLFGEIEQSITVRAKPWARSLDVTSVDVALNRVTVPNHFFQVGPTFVQFLVKSTGTLPGGLVANNAYNCFVIDANTIQFPVDITSIGTGTMSIELSVRQYGLGIAGCSSGSLALVAGKNLRHTIAFGAGPMSGGRYVTTRDVRCGTVTGEGNVASVYDQHPGTSDCSVSLVAGTMSAAIATEEAVTLQGCNASVGMIDIVGGGGPLILVQSTGTGDDRPNVMNIGMAKGYQVATNGFLLVVDTSAGITDQRVSINIDSLGGVGWQGVDIRPNISPVDCFIGKIAARLLAGPIALVNNGTKDSRLTIDHVDIDRTATVNWDYNFYEQGGANHIIRVNTGAIRDASGTGGFKINNRTLGGKISLGTDVIYPTVGTTFKNIAGGGDVFRDSQAIATV